MTDLRLIKPRQLWRRTFTALLGSTALLAGITGNTTANLDFEFKPMPYTYGIDAFADFNVSVPIATPPGFNGLKPTLALTYHSDYELNLYGKSGAPGGHWNISGIPVIRNCTKKTYNTSITNPQNSSLSGYKLCLVDGNSELPFNPVGTSYYVPAQHDRNVTSDIRLYTYVQAASSQWGDLQGKCAPRNFPHANTQGSVVEGANKTTQYILVNHDAGLYQCFTNPDDATITNSTVYVITRTMDRHGNTMKYFYNSRRLGSCFSAQNANGRHRPLAIEYGHAGATEGQRTVSIEFDWIQYSRTGCSLPSGSASLAHFGDKGTNSSGEDARINIPARINIYTKNKAGSLDTAARGGALASDNRQSDYSYFFRNDGNNRVSNVQRCHSSVFNAPNHIVGSYPSSGNIHCKMLAFGYGNVTEQGRGQLKLIHQYMKQNVSLSHNTLSYRLLNDHSDTEEGYLQAAREIVANANFDGTAKTSSAVTRYGFRGQVGSSPSYDFTHNDYANGYQSHEERIYRGNSKSLYAVRYVARKNWSQKDDGTALYHVTETFVETGQHNHFGLPKEVQVYTSTVPADRDYTYNVFTGANYSVEIVSNLHKTFWSDYYKRFPRQVSQYYYKPNNNDHSYISNTKYTLTDHNTTAKHGDGLYEVQKVTKVHTDMPDGQALVDASGNGSSGQNHVTTAWFEYETSASNQAARYRVLSSEAASCRKSDSDKNNACDKQGAKTEFAYDSTSGNLSDTYVYGNLIGLRENAHTTGVSTQKLTQTSYAHNDKGLLTQVTAKMFEPVASESNLSIEKKRSIVYRYDANNILSEVEKWTKGYRETDGERLGYQKFEDYNYAYGVYATAKRSTKLDYVTYQGVTRPEGASTTSDLLQTTYEYDAFGTLRSSTTGEVTQHFASEFCPQASTNTSKCTYSQYGIGSSGAAYVVNRYQTVSDAPDVRRGESWVFFDTHHRAFRTITRSGVNLSGHLTDRAASNNRYIVSNHKEYDRWGRVLRTYSPYTYGTDSTTLAYTENAYNKYGLLSMSRQLGDSSNKEVTCYSYDSLRENHSWTVSQEIYNKNGLGGTGNLNCNSPHVDPENLVTTIAKEYRPLGLYSESEFDKDGSELGEVIYTRQLGTGSDKFAAKEITTLSTGTDDGGSDSKLINYRSVDHFGHVYEEHGEQLGRVTRTYNAFGMLERVQAEAVDVTASDPIPSSALVNTMIYDDFGRVTSKSSQYLKRETVDSVQVLMPDAGSFTAAHYQYDGCNTTSNSTSNSSGNSLGLPCSVTFWKTETSGSVTNTVGTIEIAYDSYQRPTSVRKYADGKHFNTFTSYNNAGQPETITYPRVTGIEQSAPFKIKHNYNALGALEGIYDATGLSDYAQCTGNGTVDCSLIWKPVKLGLHGLEESELAGGKLKTVRDYVQLTGNVQNESFKYRNNYGNYANVRHNQYHYEERSSSMSSRNDTWNAPVACSTNTACDRHSTTDLFGYDAKNQMTSHTHLFDPTPNSSGPTSRDTYTNTLAYYDSGNISSSVYSIPTTGSHAGNIYSGKKSISGPYGYSDSVVTTVLRGLDVSRAIARVTLPGKNTAYAALGPIGEMLHLSATSAVKAVLGNLSNGILGDAIAARTTGPINRLVTTPHNYKWGTTAYGLDNNLFYDKQGMVKAVGHAGIVDIEYNAYRKPTKIVTDNYTGGRIFGADPATLYETTLSYLADNLSYLKEEIPDSPTVESWFASKLYQETVIDDYNELTARHFVYAGDRQPVAAKKVTTNAKLHHFRVKMAWHEDGRRIQTMDNADALFNGTSSSTDVVQHKSSQDSINFFDAPTGNLSDYRRFPTVPENGNKHYALQATIYYDNHTEGSKAFFGIKHTGRFRLRARKVGEPWTSSSIIGADECCDTDLAGGEIGDRTVTGLAHIFNEEALYELELTFVTDPTTIPAGMEFIAWDIQKGDNNAYELLTSSSLASMSQHVTPANGGVSLPPAQDTTRDLAAVAQQPRMMFVHHAPGHGSPSTPPSGSTPSTPPSGSTPSTPPSGSTPSTPPSVLTNFAQQPIESLSEMDQAIDFGVHLGNTTVGHINFSDLDASVSGKSTLTGVPSQEFSHMPMSKDNFAYKINGHIYFKEAGNHELLVIADEGVSLHLEGNFHYQGVTPQGEAKALHRIPITVAESGYMSYQLSSFDNVGAAGFEAYVRYEDGTITTVSGEPEAKFVEGRATQKETGHNEDANRAIDGDLNNWSSTKTASGNWWQGILEESSIIHTLRIHNGQDYPGGCGMTCRNRLNQFYVMVTDFQTELNDSSLYPTVADASAAATWSSGLIDANSLPENMSWGVYNSTTYRDYLDIRLPVGVRGQKIVIRYADNKSEHLHLREVQVNNVHNGLREPLEDVLAGLPVGSISPLPVRGVLMERWDHITGNAVANLTGSARFPDKPNEVTLIDQLNFPDQRRDNYGSRLRTWLKPPLSGTYTFYTSGNNDYELWMSTDHDPENAVKVAGSQWTDPQQWGKYSAQQQHTVTLDANKLYYMETLQKDGAYQDHLSVGWYGPFDAPLSRNIEIIDSQYFSVHESLVQDLIFEGQGALMSRWNTSPSHVTNLADHTLYPIDSADKVARLSSMSYSTQIRDYYGGRLVAWLKPDVTGVHTFRIAGDDSVELWMSHDADPANKSRRAHFYGWTLPNEWYKHDGNSSFNQSHDMYLEAGKEYYIEVVHREYYNGDHVQLGWQKPGSSTTEIISAEYLTTTSTNATLLSSDFVHGVLSERWDGIAGNSLGRLRINSNYPDSPNFTELLTDFRLNSQVGDNYGSRSRAFFVAPTTGTYEFFISGDDDAELWLSTDENPANVQKIAWYIGHTGVDEWFKYNTQRSQNGGGRKQLVAGQRYYIEALHKEGLGNDHMSVGWKLQSEPDSSIRVMRQEDLVVPTSWTNDLSAPASSIVPFSLSSAPLVSPVAAESLAISPYHNDESSDGNISQLIATIQQGSWLKAAL